MNWEECPSGRRGPTRNRLREVSPPFGGSNPPSSANFILIFKNNLNIPKISSQIIKILKSSNNPVSGEVIGKQLGISRVAVWKNIKKLQNKGYPIVSSKKGYSLSSKDLFLEEEIKSIIKELPITFIKNVYFFEKITSTMDFAKKLGERGEQALVIAEIQTKGRGRMGREWISPKGGIWMSLVFKPPYSFKEIFILTYLSALAVIFSIEKVTNLKLTLKWPNDILYNEKKLAGILLEIKAELDKIHYVIVGIGINVNNHISSYQSSAVSLKDILQKEIEREKILKKFLQTYESLLKINKKEILNMWIHKSSTIGKIVKIITSKEVLKGKALGIDEDGALILEAENKIIKKIYSGDCIHLRNID